MTQIIVDGDYHSISDYELKLIKKASAIDDPRAIRMFSSNNLVKMAIVDHCVGVMYTMVRGNPVYVYKLHEMIEDE